MATVYKRRAVYWVRFQWHGKDRRSDFDLNDLFAEASDYVEVVRRLWDSWEDDAEVRDVATGRFVDREKLHYIDFRGRWFDVKGPSITPRPPQGQPPVVALAHSTVPYRFAATRADIALVTPHDRDEARRIVDEIHGLGGGRDVRVIADVMVFLAGSTAAAEDRKAHLDDLFGHVYRSDAFVFVGTPNGFADLVEDWATANIDGFRLRPAGLPRDLDAITREVVSLLRQRSLLPSSPRAGTLRERLGWTRPANRYAEAHV